MNWKLILQLSAFGLIMALATVSLIPEKFEPVFWLVIFVFCAWVIAKACTGRYFLHGFLVSILNCIWITAAHVIFVAKYIAMHPDNAMIAKAFPASMAVHPRLEMLIVAPVFGVIFGIILGLFSLVASKIVKKTAAAAN